MSMETENLLHENYRSSLIPVAMAHVPHSVGNEYSMYTPHSGSMSLVFEAQYVEQDAICLDMGSPGWHKLLERVHDVF